MICCKHFTYLAATILIMGSCTYAQTLTEIRPGDKSTCATPIRIQRPENPDVNVLSIASVEPSEVYQSTDSGSRKFRTIQTTNLASEAPRMIHGLAADVIGSQSAEDLLLSDLIPEFVDIERQSAVGPVRDQLKPKDVELDDDSRWMLQPVPAQTNHSKLALAEPERHEMGNESSQPMHGDDETRGWRPAGNSSDQPGYESDSVEVFMKLADSTLPSIARDTEIVTHQGLSGPDKSGIKAHEGLVIHPPSTQPYNPDQHTFEIENFGLNSVTEVVVEIEVPAWARIVASLPIKSAFSKRTAVFRFDEIMAGEKVQVHLTAIPERKGSLSFVARVSAKSKYEFGAAKDTPAKTMDRSFRLKAEPVYQDRQNSPPLRSAGIIKNPYVK